jgi:phage terminase small subunit
MTGKQKAFVREYLVDLNAKEAAVRAGYAESVAARTGYKLLHKPEVRAEVDLHQQARAERVQITQDDVLEGLIENAREARAANQYSASTQAWGLVGKHLGMFTERVEHSGGGGGPIRIEVVYADADDTAT